MRSTKIGKCNIWCINPKTITNKSFSNFTTQKIRDEILEDLEKV